MNNNICKNKKCQKPLPDGYKYKYCEDCRNKHANIFKKMGKTMLSCGVFVGATAITLISGGKINLKK